MPRWPAASDLARRAPLNAEFGRLQETFLIAAVTMILVIRTQLWLTNYPQLGGHGLHIAHLLYGGIFMVIAIGVLVTFLGRVPRVPGVIIGGIGFGFFIDELGKFITADNNYFFRPAAALIYLIFIGLFLLIRTLQRRGELAPPDRLANALDIVVAGTRRRLDENQRRRALDLLDGADREDPLVEPVRRLVQQMNAVPAPAPSRITRLGRAARRRYLDVVGRSWFRPAIAWIFAVWAAASLFQVVELVFSVGIDMGVARRGFGSDSVAHLPFVNWASLATSTASAVLVLIGLHRLRTGTRLDAYRIFELALLVAIFLTRVFAFVESQFGAVFGLAIDLALLVTLRYMIQQEEGAEPNEAVSPPAARTALTGA
ncbi:MAG TPA: hypothetical protein VGF25_20020 [Thermoleophilaceae bacterium]|jgi:hypothetical protein